MGSKEEGSVELEELEALGFTDVDWEDTGGHGTIFDDYDTLEHFQRVQAFQRTVSTYLPDGEDGADELVLMLEDLNPRLFVTLGAMARALESVTHLEDLAQVGVSARRYMEQLSDVLFPARGAKYKGMDLTSSDFKNRLLAYVDLAIPAEDSQKTERWDQFRKDLSRVLDEINGAIHGTPEKDRVTKALSDLAVLSSALLQLDPERARDPYFAFSQNITNFHARVLRDNTPRNSQ
jgi:hypothetical protein